MIDWYPEATQQRAASNLWGSYTGGPFKGVLHTTEVLRPPSSGSYYGHTSYPHFTVGLVAGEFRCWQHIPISRAARALKNGPQYTQTNTDRAIQVEIMWTAADAPNMPSMLKAGIRRLMRWIESQTGIKRQAYDSFHFYPPENGHRLGSEPWRMPLSVWDNFNGWCGHQHVPDGNVHGDPGKIDIAYLLELAATNEGEDDMITGFDKNPEDVARATIRELCDTHWGYQRMTTADQEWLLASWREGGREMMMVRLLDHPKAKKD